MTEFAIFLYVIIGIFMTGRADKKYPIKYGPAPILIGFLWPVVPPIMFVFNLGKASAHEKFKWNDPTK